MNTPIRSLCLYCGSRTGTNPQHEQSAHDFGAALARADIGMVYGGGSIGLMGVAARACLEGGGHVTGIIPGFLDQLEVGERTVSDFVVVETMHERKWQMVERADGFVALPGGLGTLDELAEVLTWKLLRLHAKPVFLVGAAGYWQPFIALIDHIIAEGFADQSVRELLSIQPDIPSLMNACKLGKY